MNFQLMNKQRKFVLIAAAAGILAVFLPWQTVSAGLFGQSMSQGVNGFRGLGIVVFLAFVAAGILAVAGDQSRPLEKTNWLAALAAGVVALICVVITMFNTSDGFGFVEIGIGVGCWFALAAALGITAFTWLFRKPGESLKAGLENLKKNISSSEVKSPPATDKVAELEKLIKLKNDGHITEDEYHQMKKNLLPLLLLPLLLLGGCKSKPSESDIKRKILLEYVCAETAKVHNLKVVSTQDAEGIFGGKGYQYQVNGEVEWANGCTEFGTGIHPGFREKFENKTVFLIKDEEGNWR